MGEATTTDACSRHTRAKSQGRPPRMSGSQPTRRSRPTHHDLSLDGPLSREPTTLRRAPDAKPTGADGAQFHAGNALSRTRWVAIDPPHASFRRSRRAGFSGGDDSAL
jgi:hypothetical protein